ncbi:MAG: TlpA family protein disulfide reductase [Phycisphaerales bacterium JB063]
MHRFVKASFLIAALALLVVTTTTFAGNDDVTLEGVDLGTHVYGPEVEAADLEGKVVVYEYWGDRCPPCIRAIPHVVELQAEYGSDKLVVVANQVWTQDTDAAKNAWINAGGSEAITVINHGGLDGAQVTGVPHSFIFSHEGELLWHGHPMRMDEPLAQAIAALEADAPAQN